MASSTIPAFRSALKVDIDTQLTADAVTGVTTFEFPPGDQASQTDLLFIGKIRGGQSHLVFAGQRIEELTADVIIFVLTKGAGDTAAATSEDRARTIANSVETAIRNDATVTASTFHAQITNSESDNGVDDRGRYCQWTITVDAESHI